MNQNQPNGVQVGRALQVVLRVLGGLVVLTAAAVLIIVWMVSRDPTYGTNPEKALHPIRVYTPFSFRNPTKLEEFTERYKLPLYPGSAGHEGISSNWLLRAAGEPERGAAVELTRYRVEASLEQVDEWYQEQLGPGFTRFKGQPLELGQGTEGWIRRFPAEPTGEAVLFQKEEISRGRVLRGVILQPRAGDTGALLTLFEYIEARPKQSRRK